MSATELHVLLVDDESSLREPLAKFLRENYLYAVETAADGQQALEKVRHSEQSYQVALIDDMLVPIEGEEPRPMGIELMGKIKAHSPQTEVIIFTGWGLERGLTALRAGAFRYLAKPINLEELAILILHAAEYQKLKGAAREKQILEQLMETSAVLLGEQSQNEVFDHILKGIHDLGFDRVRLYLLSEDEKSMAGKAQVGMDEQILGVQWPVADDFYMQILVKEPRPHVFKREKGKPVPFEDRLSKEGVDEWACVPIILKGKVIGKLSVDNKSSHRPIIEEELRPIAIFASLAAAAIENTRLLEESKQWTNQLETLRQTTLAITSSIDRKTILSTIVQQAVELIQAKSGGIYEYNPQGGELTVVADYGHSKSVLGKVLRVGEGMAGRLILNKEPFMIVNDYATWEGRSAKFAEREFRSVIEVPLIWQGQRIGILYVDDALGRKFLANDAHLLGLFADQAAIALVNANVLSDLVVTRDRLDRLVASSFDGIVTIDLDGIVTGFNSMAENILGYKAIDVIDKPVDELYYDQEEPKRIGKLLWEDPRGRLTDYDTYVKSKSSEKIPIRLSATWLFDAQGKRIGSAGYFKDMRAMIETESHRKLLLEGINAVARAKNLQLGLTSLAEKMVAACQVTFCHILLPGDDGQSLVVQAAFHVSRKGIVWESRANKTCQLLQKPEFVKLLNRKKPMVIKKGAKNYDYVLPHLAEQIGLQGPLQSALLIPLKVGKKALGLCVVSEMRSWDRSPFTKREIELTQSLVAQASVLIEKMRLLELTQQRLVEIDRRGQLLAALDEASLHIRAEKEKTRLLHEIVRLAAGLVGCSAGCFFDNRPNVEELEIVATYGLPNNLLGNRLPYMQGVVGTVAEIGESVVIEDYSDKPDREAIFEPYHFKTVILLPLKQAGKVEAVLLVADNTGSRQFIQADYEILERFASQAAVALQTSRLLDREQRMFSRLEILHEISDYIQGAGDLDKILRVVLTGITAGYGLGLNRAALFLLDERRENIEGHMGIGYLEKSEAEKDWADHYQRGMEDFRSFRNVLEQDSLQPTPLERRIRGLILALKSPDNDLFSRTILDRKWSLVTKEEFKKLPSDFIQAFSPAFPLVVVPLTAREQVIGLLVADNKFTQSPITHDTVEELLTFTNTAAVVIDNAQLFRNEQGAREKLRSSFEASNALVSSLSPQKVIENIVAQTQQAAGAAWVSLILIDEMGRARNLITTGLDDQVDINEVIRPNGTTLKVMNTGEKEFIEDTFQQRESVNPRMFLNKVRAALCLPMSLQGKRIGVMWLHYNEPRHFPSFEIEALQFYVNQAAIAYDGARRMELLEHMREAAQALAGGSDLQGVLELIVTGAKEVFSADSAAVWSFDDIRDRFLPESSMAVGIPAGVWETFKKAEPQRGQTASKVMDLKWIGVDDVADVQQYPFLGVSTRELLGQIGIKSFQGIALTVGDEKLGVLYVNYIYPHYFSSEARENARTFANQAALALKKAKLLDQVSKARNTAQVVAEVTTLGDLKSTLDSIVEGTCNTLGCDVVTLYTYDQECNEFGFPPTMVGVLDEKKVLEFGYVAKNSVPYRIIEQDALYVTEDSPADPIMGGGFTEREGIKSSTGIALKVKNQKVGALFANYREPHHFSEDELTNISLFAHQAAVAIKNAQLFQETESARRLAEKAQRRTELVSYISHRANTNLEIVEVLDTIYQELKEIIQAPILPSVVLWDKKDNCLKLVKSNVYDYKSKLVNQEKNRDCIALGEGITGWVAFNKQSLYVPDVNIDNRYKRFVDTTKSELAVPIIIGEDRELIGVLDLESPAENAFSSEEIALIETIANYLAVTVRNAHLHSETKKRADVLDGLYEAGQAITETLTLDETLKQISEQALHIIGAKLKQESCFSHVALLIGDKLRFIATSSSEILDALRSIPDIDLTKSSSHIGIAGRVARSGNSENVGNVHQDEDYIMLKPYINSQISVPLKIGRNIIGVLSIEHAEPNAFIGEDVRNVELLAAQAAVAIQNARRMYQLEHLRAAAEAMTGLGSVQDILQQITLNAKEVLGADSTAIWAYDDIHNQFTPNDLVSIGIPAEFVEVFRRESPHPDGIAYTVLKKNLVEVIDIGSNNYPFIRESSRKLLKRLGVRSFLGVALIVGEEKLGVLYVNYNHPRGFSEDEQETARTFANQAALALKKARLLEQIKKTKRAAEVVAEVMTLGDVKATLASVAHGTKEAVNCDAVVLFVYNNVTGRLDHPPTTVGVHQQEEAERFGEVDPNSIVYTMLSRDEPYVVERISEDKLFRDRRFARDEEIQSLVAIPLVAAGEKVGVMFVHYRSSHHFVDDELTNIYLFAHQAAIAIRNAQLHAETKKRADVLEGLYEAGKAITGTLTLDETLHRIAEQALYIVGTRPDLEGFFSHVALLEGKRLRFIAASSQEILLNLHRKFGEIDLTEDRKAGVTARAARKRCSENVGDVKKDPDYIPLNPLTSSQLSVPLMIGSQIIGVLSIEHPEINAFSEEDLKNVELLAAQASVAIENARRYEELNKTKGLIGGRTALAWVGMTSSAWRHTIEKHAITIREQIQLLRYELTQKLDLVSISERLSMIERLANKILEKPITSPLSAEEGAQSVPINYLVQERTKQLWNHEPYRSVSLKLDLALEDSVTTRASPEWLRRALDILVDNAIEATNDLPNRKVILITRKSGNWGEISIIDNGKGISDEILSKILTEPIIKQKGSKGLGMGLLFAQVIVQTYGGQIQVGSTGSHGTTMKILLPLEK